MNIIMASDDRGADMMLVAIYSVIKNNQTDKLNFYVIHTDISKDNLNRVKNLQKKFANTKINFILADKKLFENVELTNKAVSMPAYYRYLAPTLLPKEDRALYMDIDMLCIDNLKELYSLNLGDLYMGAVEDYFVSQTDDYPGFKEGIGLAKKDKYVNSGLLLMDLAKLRNSGIMEKFWHNIVNKSKIIPAKFNVFADQTIMNITFNGKVKLLDSKYNAMTTAMKHVKPKDVTIVHFTGSDKPFTYRDEYYAEYDDMYYDYYNECMDIVGGNGNLMIKNTIKRLGRETTEAINKLGNIEQLARDKANHVIELAEQLDTTRREVDEIKRAMNEITTSASWRLTRPFRGVDRIVKQTMNKQDGK